MGKTARWLVPALILIALTLATALALVPAPIEIDSALVTLGPMTLTVEEEGRTRIRERYVVSSPLGGRLRRITLNPGDRVIADRTVLAVINPTDPELLDARAHAEAQARVRAASAAVEQASSNVDRAMAAMELTRDDFVRLDNAHEQKAATTQERERARFLLRIATEEHNSATHAHEIAQYELELAQSALVYTSGAEDGEAQLRIESPITGEVLRVFQESVAVVTPGTPLLEIGDRTDLEIVIDVLSTDGVRISPGDHVIIDHWGGERRLEAIVRLVEPSAFTKVSALGIEEQRVNVIADFVSPASERATLGDGFRVEAGVIIWSKQETLRVPTSAVFRHDGVWAVFVLENGRAVIREFVTGKQNGTSTQAVEGLSEGDAVIVHPSDLVADGKRVKARD